MPTNRDYEHDAQAHRRDYEDLDELLYEELRGDDRDDFAEEADLDADDAPANRSRENATSNGLPESP